MARKSTRREFLRHTTYAGAGLWVLGSAGCGGFLMGPRPRRISPNEKMNVAGIGGGGKGDSDIKAASEGNNIVAVCDVDFDRAAGSFKAFPKAKQYKDYRKMLDEMSRQIDAVMRWPP